MELFFYLLPLLAGVAMTTQAGVNSQLREVTNSSITASFISFIIGTIALAVVVIATGQPFPNFKGLGEIAWYKYLGGLLGAAFVTIVVVSTQRLSASELFALIVAGQLITALFFDHFGFAGFRESPATVTRVIGAVLLVVGAYLINQK